MASTENRTPVTDADEPSERDDDAALMPSGDASAESAASDAAALSDASYESDFADFISALGLRHFRSSEFLVMGGQNSSGPCRGLNHFPDRSLWPRITGTAKVLDELRERLGAAIGPTSVYRSDAYNACIPGAAGGSLHRQFNAVDFKCQDGNDSVHWAKELKRMRDAGFFRGGIGVYGTFVHVDTRGSNANFGPLRDRVF